jgi:hypothetical protein
MVQLVGELGFRPKTPVKLKRTSFEARRTSVKDQ